VTILNSRSVSSSKTEVKKYDKKSDKKWKAHLLSSAERQEAVDT
jgi:hypothetical protein